MDIQMPLGSVAQLHRISRCARLSRGATHPLPAPTEFTVLVWCVASFFLLKILCQVDPHEWGPATNAAKSQ